MGKALELVTFITTAAGASGVAGAALAGNSLTVRNGGKAILALSAWRTGQAVGFVRFTSPFLHDGLVGVDLVVPSGQSLLLPVGEMELQPQDQLVVTMGGSATAGDIEHVSVLIYYQDLPGMDAHLIGYEEYRRRVVDFHAAKNTVTTGTTGQYTGAETIVAEQDALKARTEYALLGCSVQVGVHAIRWLGPDLGNLGIGMPAIAGLYSSNTTFFVELARRTGLPTIPVINSANKSLTYIDAVTDENGVDPVVSTIYGRLK